MGIKSILIIEDDESVRAGLKLLFEEEGYSVLEAIHGQDALDILDKKLSRKIGLILLDFKMPVMDGPTFLRELHQNRSKILSTIPIFITTASDNNIRQVPLKTTGILTKPFDMDELLRIVNQYCGA